MSERIERCLWPLVAAVLAAWVVAFPLTNTDIWWHLASGRHMVVHGLPAADPFSVSARGFAWVNIHWLFQLAAYGVWSLGGVLGLVLAKAAVCGIGAAALVAATPRGVRGSAVLILVTSLFAVRHLVMVRPIVISLLLLSLFFLLLERYRWHGDWRVLVLLPVLQVLWVNTQGLHTLGPGLVVIYLGGSVLHRMIDGAWEHPWQPLAVTLSGCAAGSFASPYGVGAALLPWKLLGRIDPALANIYAVNVSEFVPPWQLERAAPGATLHLSLFLLLLALALFLSRRRWVWEHVVLVGALTALALMANRNILLLYWLGAPVLAGALVRGLRDVRVPRGLVPVAVAALAVAVVSTREGRLSGPAPFRVPEAAASRLAELEAGGNVFCSVRYGGYLAWRLHPRWSPYIDGRLILRSREQFAEYLEVVDEPARFDAFRERHNLVAAVLPTAFPDRYLRLIGYLIEHPDWGLVSTDGTEVLMLYRTHSPVVDLTNWDQVVRLRQAIFERYPKGTTARSAAVANLAGLLVEVGRFVDARVVLAEEVGAAARGLVARSHYLEGDLDLATLQAERLLAEDSDDLDSRILLAAIAIDRGQLAGALAELRRVLDIAPYNAEANRLLRRLEATP